MTDTTTVGCETHRFSGETEKLLADAARDVRLRDYFAAAAITGSLAEEGTRFSSPEAHARWAYEIADAMMEARK